MKIINTINTTCWGHVEFIRILYTLQIYVLVAFYATHTPPAAPFAEHQDLSVVTRCVTRCVTKIER